MRSREDGDRTPATMLATELVSEGFSLFAALRLPGILQTWLLGRDGSWAHQVLEHGELVAVQDGGRRLWDEIETAHGSISDVPAVSDSA
ncbi:MAG: hypothetical protein ACRDQ5_11245 [Sciscionella sp.]